MEFDYNDMWYVGKMQKTRFSVTETYLKIQIDFQLTVNPFFQSGLKVN